MGKWSQLKDSLPRLQGDDSNWQQEVRAWIGNFVRGFMTAKMRRPTLGEIGNAYNDVRARKDALNEQLSKINVQIEGLTQLLVSEMEDAGVTSVKLADGSTLFLKDEPYSKVVNRSAYVAWIKEQSHEDLLQVNFMTTNSLVKERLESGETVPPGVEVFMKTSLTRRKG